MTHSLLVKAPRSLHGPLFAALLFVVLLAPGPAYAHPLGNFTINHFSRIQVGSDSIRLRYVIDMAEIPSFQEIRSFELPGEGAPSEAELDGYMQRQAKQFRDGLHLSVDGAHLRLNFDSGKIFSIPGAGGLPTLRLEYQFSTQQLQPSRPHQLGFEDTNNAGRIGWREIVIQPRNGVTVYNSSAFSNSISDELRSYPADRLGSPLNEYRSVLSWTAGPVPSGVSLLRTRGGRSVESARDRFAELITVRQLTPAVMFFGLLLAACLGAVHALSPGHGKTVVGAYLVGSRGTARHAALLGLTVTVTHTAGVFALGLLTMIASRYILPERLFPVLTFFSGALVAFIGFTLFSRRLSSQLTGGISHSHSVGDHGLDGSVHSHGFGWSHSHLPSEIDGQTLTIRNLVALGVSGGLLPCPSALVVLLSAIALHRVGYGLLLVLAFSLGLATTLVAIGLAFVYAGRWLAGLRLVRKAGVLRQWMPILSSFVVAGLGVVICSQATRQMGADPLALVQNALSRWHSVASGQQSLASLGGGAVLVFGLLLGLKHATEADHVMAVSSIVSEHRKLLKVAVVGGLWGLGHTLTLVFVGFFVLLLGIGIPERISQLLEFGVGLMIVGLSGTALYRLARGRGSVPLRDGMEVAGSKHQPQPEPRRLGVGLKPFVVGAVHGLAGSAALTLLVLTQIHSVALGLTYLLIFGFGSLLGMMFVSTLVGLPFALSLRNLSKFATGLQAATGCAGLCFGFWYAFSTGSAAFR